MLAASEIQKARLGAKYREQTPDSKIEGQNQFRHTIVLQKKSITDKKDPLT